MNFLSITGLVETIRDFVWGPATIVALLGAGILFTVRTRFFQVRHFFTILRRTIGSIGKKRENEKGVSPFSAMSAALAATLGVGNIVGVSTAMAIGGAGAVFWMWVSAFFGMMTKYAEVTLAVQFRVKNKRGEWSGGPMWVLSQTRGGKIPAAAFALFGVLASFGIGSMTQANAVAQAAQSAFGAKPAVTGTVVAILAALVLIGGVGRICKVTQALVPFMALFYLAGAVWVIVAHAGRIGPAFCEILSGAFSLEGAAGGITGSLMAAAIRIGVSRGVFSNEAGMGSAAIVHAAADTPHPAEQGLWGAFEVFADTLVVCTVTALAILCSGVTEAGALSGVSMQQVFAGTLGSFGGMFLSVSVMLFAFATIVGWSYYGQQCGEYLLGERIRLPYRVLYVLSSALGAVAELTLVWNLSDVFNGLMVIPNLVALLLQSRTVVRLTRERFPDRKQSGKRKRKGEGNAHAGAKTGAA